MQKEQGIFTIDLYRKTKLNFKLEEKKPHITAVWLNGWFCISVGGKSSNRKIEYFRQII